MTNRISHLNRAQGAIAASIAPAALVQTNTYTTATSGTSYVVPSNAAYLWVKMWGAGGAGSAFSNSFSDSDGGGGGYSEALVAVTHGETLTVRIGGTGENPRCGSMSPNAPGGTNGGGKGTDTDSAIGAGGGGYTGLFRSSTALVIAGGGGGGAANSSSKRGGAGGGSTGQDGQGTGAGGGGTQSAGGAAGTNGNVGSSLTGANYNSANIHGTGGGGGYYGGGSASSGYQAGAGGGSGYIGAAGNTHATTTQGDYRTPANTSDADFPGSNYAYGGIGVNSNVCAKGKPGYMIIRAYTGDPFEAGILS